MSFSTADLCDAHKERLQVLELPLQSYGGLTQCSGEIVTVKLDQNNKALVELLRDHAGEGRVVVVDVEANYNAVVGDNLMKFAHENGWSGIIIHGYVRDIAITRTIPVGLFALGTCPKKSFADNPSQLGNPLSFGGVTFTQGAYLYADEDGVIVAENLEDL
jgi:regulator of ribonuclease activity A